MSIEQQANTVKQMLLDEMQNSAEVVFEGILDNRELASIPESLFLNYFLPCFLNRVKNDKWVTEWISIAGTPMSEVNVVDNVTKEVLFTVPSLLNTSSLVYGPGKGDMSNIFSHYEQLSENIPSAGLNFLIEALNAKNTEALSKLNMDYVTKKWMDIFERYNLISRTSEDASRETEDLFEY
jgi:hypothetical protein